MPLSMLLGASIGRLSRLPAELPAVPHEGLLLPHRLVRRGRGDPAHVEVERSDVPVRRTEGHQAHPAYARHRLGTHDRFLRAGELLLSLPHRGRGVASHSLSHRTLAHRAHLPRHPLAGQARRVRRRRYVPLPHAGLRHLGLLRRSRRRALCPLRGRGRPEPVRRGGDGLRSDLGHRRRHRDLLWTDHRRGGADRSQRGDPALPRRGRDAADVLRRDPDRLHPVPAARAGEPRARRSRAGSPGATTKRALARQPAE